MVRRRVEIHPIEDKARRHTTYTKRRKGLIKKTEDFCKKFSAEAAVVAISKAGNVIAYGNPTVEAVVNRYLAEESGGEERVQGLAAVKVEIPAPEVTEAEQMIMDAIGRGRPAWDAAVCNLGLGELDEMELTMTKIKKLVAARAMEVAKGP